jgi:hypothetical protein
VGRLRSSRRALGDRDNRPGQRLSAGAASRPAVDNLRVGRSGTQRDRPDLLKLGGAI